MADYLDHIKQAEHNEALCEILLANQSYHRFRDWIVTVTFYAAIHYVEASFAQDRKIQHSELNKPTGISLHDHREDLVRLKYGDETWRVYKRLREASQLVRYLSLYRIGTGSDYFSLKTAENFFRHDLSVIKTATGH
jgi:hypothetical protein